MLTHTNDESVLITSLLKQEGIPASLVSDKQGFSLRGILEIKTFTHFIFKNIQDGFGLITEDVWESRKTQLYALYVESKNLDLVKRIIESFEKVNPKKFKSTWNIFLKEISIEDFYHPEKEKVFVSTMHKSKGKEFDHVFILLNNYPLQSEEQKRVVYVAMTRAKENLFIHTNNINFPMEGIAALEYREDGQNYDAPDTIILECGMKDINLGYFKTPQIIRRVKSLDSVTELFVDPIESSIFQDENRNRVLKFSQAFQDKLIGYTNSGYQLQSAFAKYVVVWYEEDSGKEFRVVLPELVMKK